MAAKSKRRISPVEFVALLTADEKESILEAWPEGFFDHKQAALFRKLSTSTKRKAERVLPLIAKLRIDCEALAKLHTFGPSKGRVNFGRPAEITEFLMWLSKIEPDWQNRAGREIPTGRPDVAALYLPITRKVGAIARRHGINVTTQGVFPAILDAVAKSLRLKDWRPPNPRTLGHILAAM